MKIKIAIAQISTVLGVIEPNLAKHLQMIERAKEDGADLVIFPELSLTGYALQDLVSAVAFSPREDNPHFNQLIEKSRDIDIVVGFVEEDQRNRFFISGAYLSCGKVVHIHRKVYLPTYGLFDEGRFFAWGDHIRAFDTRFGRMGVLICEDFWHISPPYLLWLDGADLFIFTSASPGRGLTDQPALESADWVEHTNRAYAGLFTSFVIHANRAGFEDGLNFWGGSTIYDPDGKLVVRGPYHQEELITAEIDLNQTHRTRTRLPLLRDERTELVNRELQRILS